MNAPTAFARRTFTAWWQVDDGRVATPERLFASTLAEIEREIARPSAHGFTYFILERDELTDAQVLHVYVIQKGKWLGQHSGKRKVYPYRAHKLFSLPVKSFQPSEPFRVTRDCDAVGLGDLIEGRVS